MLIRSVAALPSHLRDLTIVDDPDCFGCGIRTLSAMDLTIALICGVAVLLFHLPDLIINHAPDSIHSAVEFGPFPMWNSDLFGCGIRTVLAMDRLCLFRRVAALPSRPPDLIIVYARILSAVEFAPIWLWNLGPCGVDYGPFRPWILRLSISVGLQLLLHMCRVWVYWSDR